MKQSKQLGMSLLGVMTLVTVATASPNDGLSANDIDIVNKMTHTEVVPGKLRTTADVEEGDYIQIAAKNLLVVETFNPNTNTGLCPDGKAPVFSTSCVSVMTTGTFTTDGTGIPAGSNPTAASVCAIMGSVLHIPSMHVATGQDLYSERSDSVPIQFDWFPNGGNTFSTVQWTSNYNVISTNTNVPQVVDVWTGAALTGAGNVYCFADIAY